MPVLRATACPLALALLIVLPCPPAEAGLFRHRSQPCCHVPDCCPHEPQHTTYYYLYCCIHGHFRYSGKFLDIHTADQAAKWLCCNDNYVITTFPHSLDGVPCHSQDRMRPPAPATTWYYLYCCDPSTGMLRYVNQYKTLSDAESDGKRLCGEGMYSISTVDSDILTNVPCAAFGYTGGYAGYRPCSQAAVIPGQ
jgi:hypothetical protein